MLLLSTVSFFVFLGEEPLIYFDCSSPPMCVYSSSVESASFIYTSSPVPPTPPVNKQLKNDHLAIKPGDDKLEAERLTMYKCILNSIIESETVYVECLTVMLQYMKALKATLTTSQPVINTEDFNTIFYKIPELHSLHHSFLEGLRDHLENPEEKPSVADQFKMLAGKLNIYGSFLQKYTKAVDTIRRCNAGSSHFCEITKTIKLKTLKGQVITLEDLLHKPVARVQKNALVLHDLLKYTPEDLADYKTFKSALKLTQCFLNELNMVANEGMFPPADRTQRHLVKNSFIVELTEGHRKLRHLFLFNDVIVCAKYKPSSRSDFSFVTQSEVHIREYSSIDVLTLKARASTVREHILREEKLNLTREKPKAAVRNLDKHKKKLSELEAQLVLASPNLVFRIGHKSGKMYTFFVGSEFDRFQWTEALKVLHTSALPNPPLLSVMELQAWIASCLDEELLVGTLQISLINMQEIIRPGDLFICCEVDSYGHFFRKAKTRLVHCSESVEWKQDFVVDLEGSQTLRIICYEQQSNDSGKHTNTVIRGKSVLELSRNWLGDNIVHRKVQLNEMKLSISLKFMAKDYSLKKIPLSRTVGTFGMKVNQVCKKEKSNIPLVIINCVNEAERRGMKEVGIYRVSGSASDVQRLKKGFETKQLLKELDIHATTGLLKMYLRELPEALFTDLLYPKFFEAFSLSNADQKSKNLLSLFVSLPQINQNVIVYLIDHMVRVNEEEASNKMSLHNLATVFGPTLLRPGSGSIGSSPSDMLAAGTIDVMAQAGILYFFLKRKAAGLTLVKNNSDTAES
ncbi:Active breakpoint cluster region-related protein [Nymphon striatum]|nr:Active breakpoint cluster region-related protein [Nymphon striatum]